MYFVVIWVLCGALCAFVASQKGRSVGGWFVLGCIGGIFSIIAICAVPKL
jgi:hypothetical protein